MTLDPQFSVDMFNVDMLLCFMVVFCVPQSDCQHVDIIVSSLYSVYLNRNCLSTMYCKYTSFFEYHQKRQIKTIFWGGYIFTTRMNIFSISAAEKPNKYGSFSAGNSTFITDL